MWKGLCFGLLCLAVVQAAVIRPETTEATATTTPIPEDDESTTTVASNTSALSRDEEASILIDPAPGTLQEDEAPLQEKSGKLLLLSTPPKRPVEIERQLEEDEEDEQDSPAESEPTTTVPPKAAEEEIKQEEPEEEEATVTTESSATPATTKLFAVDARPAKEDSPPPNVAVSLSQDNVTVSISEQPQVPGDNNAAVELAIVEPEAEYVLVDSSHDGFDIDLDPDLQLGSFTHIDSDVHLQPAVHSVEIVPTSFDDPLIVNYVHNLR
ncbi:hypothetical protein KR067_011454 [Drosophila pandora]|nr:hypothetical protein KR067_011454 [Drosophila pandora]